VESQLGRGSLFTVRLPSRLSAAQDDAAAVPAPGATDPIDAVTV